MIYTNNKVDNTRWRSQDLEGRRIILCIYLNELRGYNFFFWCVKVAKRRLSEVLFTVYILAKILALHKFIIFFCVTIWYSTEKIKTNTGSKGSIVFFVTNGFLKSQRSVVLSNLYHRDIRGDSPSMLAPVFSFNGRSMNLNTNLDLLNF